VTHSSRRRFLRFGAASLLAAPFVRLLHGGSAFADGAPAKRLLVYFSPNGTIPNQLWPSGGTTDFTFAAGSVLEPLEAIRDKVTILKGLQFYNATNHEGGMAAMLTNNGGASTESQGMSIDQFVASRIGTSTRFSSLEFGVQTSAWGGSTQTRMAYAGPGGFITPDDSPNHAYQRMFGDLLGGEDGAVRLRGRRTRIVDIARAELVDLHRRVGAEERIKLEAHIEALAAMERGLSATTTCEPGQAPGITGSVWANGSFPAIATAQMDLAVTALACGMTNVASIQMAHTVSPVVFSWLGLNEGHHSLSHTADSNSGGVADYVAAERWFAQRYVDLVQALDALPDPEGDGSMLDSTLVLWAQEMGDGRLHVCTDVPFVIAGATDHFQGGRFLDLGERNHCHLLVSICNAFGLANETFGDPDAGTGPLSELTA
jgi:hypothetical protein